MFAPAVCDSVATPVQPGEQLGATPPLGVQPHRDSAVVIGTVTEVSSNRTMSGAGVRFRPLPEADSTRRPSRYAHTNYTGGFEIRSLAPGSYRLWVGRIGMLPIERQVNVRAGVVDTFVVELRPWRCIGY